MTRNELKTKKIAVLLGGLSAEREISLRTGRAVLAALQEAGYPAVGIDAGRDLAARLAEEKAAVAFIALHGRFGEDGTVQGLLEMLGIPYTGSGVMASAIAMDKVTTKKILLYHELPTPAFNVFCRGDDLEAFLSRCRHFPLVVKPAREGSTIGVSIVRDGKALRAGIESALVYDGIVLVEDFIKGLEVTVGVLDGEALPVIQVVPKGGFYDFEAKYTAGRTEYLVPAPLDGALYERLQQVAVSAFCALGCAGAARVDFMVSEREFFCLEVNTIPGMTETSLLPKAARQTGISFGELVQRILEGAALSKEQTVNSRLFFGFTSHQSQTLGNAMRDLKSQKSGKVKINRRKRQTEPRDWRKLFQRVLYVGVFLGKFALVVLLLGGAMLAARQVFHSGYFDVAKVRVENLGRVSEEEIVALSDIRPGMNIFDLELSMIGRKIEENPWISTASVERVLPREVVISVREREPKAVINLGYLYYLDAGGEIFKVLGPEDSLDYPVVTGIDRRTLLENPDDCRRQLTEAMALFDDLAGRRIFALHDVAELNVSKTDGLTLYTFNGGIPIRLGHSNFSSKLDRLERIYPELEPRLLVLKYIDLNVADRVIVKVDNSRTIVKG